MSTDKKQDPWNHPAEEFGGPVGVTFIMIASHLTILYVWLCFEFYNGKMAIDSFANIWEHIVTGIVPSFYAFQLYSWFFLFQMVTAAIVPGFRVHSVPRADRPGKNDRLWYNCNALQAWYITLIASVIVIYFNFFDLGDVIRNLGPLTIMAMIFADCVAVMAYVITIAMGNTYKMSGNVVYDFFIGAPLHPRIGPIDLKMFSEIRWSWFILFNLTLSCAVYQYETYGVLSTPMIFMVIAHGLYTNACAKGEDLVTGAYDIIYEKWGWLLIFWNFAGVPFLYCSSSAYLAKIPPFELHPLHTALCFFLLFFGYYMFDTANAQKNSFRMRLADPKWKPRGTFPQLPWCYLDENAEHMKTKSGSCLLTDGWWRYTRKPHYVGDLMMSLSWGLITGFGSFLPYLYCASFFFILLHRRLRDETKCAKKYGEDWKKYEKRVPYIYIPGVY